MSAGVTETPKSSKISVQASSRHQIPSDPNSIKRALGILVCVSKAAPPSAVGGLCDSARWGFLGLLAVELN